MCMCACACILFDYKNKIEELTNKWHSLHFWVIESDAALQLLPATLSLTVPSCHCHPFQKETDYQIMASTTWVKETEAVPRRVYSSSSARCFNQIFDHKLCVHHYFSGVLCKKALNLRPGTVGWNEKALKDRPGTVGWNDLDMQSSIFHSYGPLYDLEDLFGEVKFSKEYCCTNSAAVKFLSNKRDCTHHVIARVKYLNDAVLVLQSPRDHMYESEITVSALEEGLIPYCASLENRPDGAILCDYEDWKLPLFSIEVHSSPYKDNFCALTIRACSDFNYLLRTILRQERITSLVQDTTTGDEDGMSYSWYLAGSHTRFGVSHSLP